MTTHRNEPGGGSARRDEPPADRAAPDDAAAPEAPGDRHGPLEDDADASARPRPDPIERDLDDELRFHFESRIEALMESGASAEEAHARARDEFGDVDGVRSELLAIDRRRATAGFRKERLGALRRDVRLAVRRLARERGFFLPAALTLGIGLGAAAAILALVHGVVLAPLPYPDADRLVAVRNTAPALGLTEGGLSDGVYEHYARHARVFDGLAVYFDRTLSITERDAPERIRTALVSPGLFGVLSATAALGRTCQPGDERAQPLRVVLSHGLWRRRYGSDPAAVGRTIELNRVAREIVGVMPADFGFPARETELWFCMPTETDGAGITDFHQTGVARLRAGITPAMAREDLQRLIRALPATYDDVTIARIEETGIRANVVPLRGDVTRDVRPALALLACAGGLMLLIAAFNVANLFLLRADRRRHEVAIARALGAGFRDLARQAMAEGLLLALAAGTLALVLAWLAVQARFGLADAGIVRLHEVRLGAVATTVTALLAAATGVLLGLAASASVHRGDEASALRSAGPRAGGPAAHRAQRVLVALQVTLAFTLAVAALSMVESARRMNAFRPGFDAADATTFEIALPARQYSDYHRRTAFLYTTIRRLEAMPGVHAAAGSFNLPLSTLQFADMSVTADRESEEAVGAVANPITPGYFEAMGMRLVAGRGFREAEALAADRPVVVSATLARRLWGDADPLGRRLRRVTAAAPAGAGAHHTVVGVVEDVPGETLAGGAAPLLYLPWPEQLPENPEARAAVPLWPGEWLMVVRADLLPAEVLSAVRRIIADLDPLVPVGRTATLEAIVSHASARTRLTALLLAVAAAVALLLGAVGVYGVVSYAVSRRTPEFGVRLALGARPEDVRRLVAGQGAAMAAGGIALGVAGGVALLHALRSLLFQVRPAEPALLGATALLLLAITVAASWAPAWRAGSVDPKRALDAS